MINSRQNSNNIFSPFPDYSMKLQNGRGTERHGVSNEQNKKIGGSMLNKKFIAGSAIASSILTAGILGLIFAGGVHGSFIKNLENKIANRIQEAGESSKRHLSYGIQKIMSGLLNLLQGISNITSIKDIACDKILGSNCITAKFGEWSRNLFGKAADRNIGARYGKIGVKVSDMTSLLQKYNIREILKLDKAELSAEIKIKGETKTLREWAEILFQHADELRRTFDEGFSFGAGKARNVKRAGLFAGLRESVWDKFFKKGGLFKASNYKGYAAEELTKDAQSELIFDIDSARRKVTNNIPAIYDYAKTALQNLIKQVKPGDKAASKSLNEVKKQIENFKNCSGADETSSRLKIAKDISERLEALLRHLSAGGNYSKSEKASITAETDRIKTVILSSGENSKGALEKIMTVLKGLNTAELQTGRKIISDAEFKKYNSLAENISSGLKETAEKEAGEYFLKQAEIEIGSAATDVFALFIPAGIGFYSINKANSKDEKISASLKTGIPLFGTFAAFIYGAASMMSGGKNLLFSAVSGILLNKAGSYIDNLYKNYKNSGSVIKTAANEYSRITSNFNAEKQNNRIETGAEKSRILM